MRAPAQLWRHNCFISGLLWTAQRAEWSTDWGADRNPICYLKRKWPLKFDFICAALPLANRFKLLRLTTRLGPALLIHGCCSCAQICMYIFIYLFIYLFLAVQFLINGFGFLAATCTLYAISCLADAKLKYQKATNKKCSKKDENKKRWRNLTRLFAYF